MVYHSYVHLTDSFIEGLKSYIKKKEVPLDSVVEVFAGNGKLGFQLGLKEGRNVSDSLLYASEDYEDDVNKYWEKEPEGVVVETAYETVIRFYEEELNINLLIMGAPLPANSYYCPSYAAAKALHYCFDAEILYIGEMSTFAFASPKFFKHMEMVKDDREGSFKELIMKTYDSQGGYFASERMEEKIEIHPYLLRFVTCQDEKCDCRDNTSIKNDLYEYNLKQKQAVKQTAVPSGNKQ